MVEDALMSSVAWDSSNYAEDTPGEWYWKAELCVWYITQSLGSYGVIELTKCLHGQGTALNITRWEILNQIVQGFRNIFYSYA